MKLNVGTKEIHITRKICIHFPVKQTNLELSNGPTLLTNHSNWSSSFYLFNRQSQTILNFRKCVIREIINSPIGPCASVVSSGPPTKNKCHVLIFIVFDHIHTISKSWKIIEIYTLLSLKSLKMSQLSRPNDLIYGNVDVDAIELDSATLMKPLTKA